MMEALTRFRRRLKSDTFSKIVFALKKQEMWILRRRPVCWMAIGFLLIISMFLVGRSYESIGYQEKEEWVYLEGRIADKQYKELVYGDYWQITLKRVCIVRQDTKHSVTNKDLEKERELRAFEEISGKVESLEGKYLCQIPVSDEIAFRIGQQILLSGKYTPWEEPANPGQFDTGKYYCSLGILGQFRKCEVIKQGTKYSKFREELWRIRRQSDLFLKQELGEEDGALISAMLLGEKSGLDEDIKHLYQSNGISHILAISGLHLMLLGMGVFKILKMILGNRQGAVLSIILMSVYCIFTGSSISTIRATIMFALSLTAGLLGRSYDSLSALGVAGILQLFINPYVMNNSGFLLSFLAVIGVTALAPRWQEILEAKNSISKSMCVSISSTLTTLPVLLCNYGTYPWYSIFLNLLILPMMSLLLFLSVLLAGIPVMGIFIRGAACGQAVESLNFILENEIFAVFLKGSKNLVIMIIKAILQYFEICCKLFEYSPFQDGYIGAPSVVQIMIYGVLIVIASVEWTKLSFFGRKMTILSALMILTVRVNISTEVTMLDVGQGDSVVICNANGNVYISDCGSSSVSKVGRYRLIPFLKYKGYGRIKGIFISHLDEDHMNGIVELLEMAPKENVIIEYLFLPERVLRIEEDRGIIEELQDLAKLNHTKIVYLKQGDKIQDGDIEFLCLHPSGENEQGNSDINRNDQSLVLLMTYKEFEMVLTGDVEKGGEQDILKHMERIGLKEKYVFLESGIVEKDRSPDGLKLEQNPELATENPECIDVLKVAHHGSSSSSCEEFLETFRPKLSLISCGRNNSYGHPHEETLERLEAVGSKVVSTVDAGAITLKVRRGKVIIDYYKL